MAQFRLIHALFADEGGIYERNELLCYVRDGRLYEVGDYPKGYREIRIEAFDTCGGWGDPIDGPVAVSGRLRIPLSELRRIGVEFDDPR